MDKGWRQVCLDRTDVLLFFPESIATITQEEKQWTYA